MMAISCECNEKREAPEELTSNCLLLFLARFAEWLGSQDLETAALKKRAKDSISEVDIANKPRRKYRHPAKHKITEEKSNVKTTLLEYGR